MNFLFVRVLLPSDAATLGGSHVREAKSTSTTTGLVYVVVHNIILPTTKRATTSRQPLNLCFLFIHYSFSMEFSRKDLRESTRIELARDRRSQQLLLLLLLPITTYLLLLILLKRSRMLDWSLRIPLDGDKYVVNYS